jgi:hypothetical protein
LSEGKPVWEGKYALTDEEAQKQVADIEIKRANSFLVFS